jgi:hypothetical protein
VARLGSGWRECVERSRQCSLFRRCWGELERGEGGQGAGREVQEDFRGHFAMWWRWEIGGDKVLERRGS